MSTLVDAQDEDICSTQTRCGHHSLGETESHLPRLQVCHHHDTDGLAYLACRDVDHFAGGERVIPDAHLLVNGLTAKSGNVVVGDVGGGGGGPDRNGRVT